jgi:hypothetical protein
VSSAPVATSAWPNRLTARMAPYTNGAEEFFSCKRRAEIGHHLHIAGVYLPRYAAEAVVPPTKNGPHH